MYIVISISIMIKFLPLSSKSLPFFLIQLLGNLPDKYKNLNSRAVTDPSSSIDVWVIL